MQVLIFNSKKEMTSYLKISSQFDKYLQRTYQLPEWQTWVITI